MTQKDESLEKSEEWFSSALKVNLERTSVAIAIPPKYDPLLKVVEGHYGLQRKTRGMLTELYHPFVNWEHVLAELTSISIGDFYEYNQHPDGLTALSILMNIYFDIIKYATNEEVKDSAIRCLFDFIGTVLEKSDSKLSGNLSLLNESMDFFANFTDKDKAVLKKCSSYIKKTAKFILDNNINIASDKVSFILDKMFRITYEFWLTQSDPSLWFAGDKGKNNNQTDAYQNIIHPLSHRYLYGALKKLDDLGSQKKATDKEQIRVYLEMPDYFQIVNGYFLVADELEKSPVYLGHQYLVKLDFLFHMMSVPGLSDIHASALREINRCLKLVFEQEEKEKLHEFVRKIFEFLRKSRSRHEYRGTIIDCITTTAKEVFARDSQELADIFIDELISYGFQYPEFKGTTTEWQVQVNPLHVVSIRAWLEIISLKPGWTKKLISAQVINLSIGGIFVRDTDLLQKDISVLLNSGIAPVYNLVKQLLRIFPVYFKEIGAEGELRDITTDVDELSYRNDKLVNFLRKQSHVESNSMLVEFMENIFNFWYSGDKECLKRYLPEEVYEQVANSGEYFDGMHKSFIYLLSLAQNNPKEFISWSETRLSKEISGLKEVDKRDKERARMMVRIYQLIYKKYFPQYVDLLDDLEVVYLFPKTELAALRRALSANNRYKSLIIILKFMSLLKERILSARKTEPYENIYYKRHIAAGIPSMYGTYSEEKFEALGLTLRLESLAVMQMEELVKSLDLRNITKRTIAKVHNYLWLFVKALELDGISTEGLAAKVRYISSALSIKQFSMEQYVDIFRFISKSIQNIIHEYYIDIHNSNLPVIIGQVFEKNVSTKMRTETQNGEELVYQQSENFVRRLISSAFGLQTLDNFVNAVVGALNAEMEKIKDENQLWRTGVSYNAELAVSSFYEKNKKVDNQIFLGNKGYFLKELISYGFKVPPGFIITTEVFRGYDAIIDNEKIFNDLLVRINKEIVVLEIMTGRRFGNPLNPLLLSVRSGATVSLPGMMNSFLNVGINEVIAEKLSGRKGFHWAAWDCYRRFLQTWGMFQGLNRDFFDAIIDGFKYRYGVERKIQFSPEQMKQIALAYKKGILDNGIELKEEPAEQLRDAIMKVFDSWYSQQAQIYRHQMHLSDKWGTAVIVQAMVFGNLNEHSGSGVIFTREPKSASSDITLYGDFIFGVQGDDIVSGLVETYPISEKQRLSERRDSEISLETKFPEIYHELVSVAEKLIREKGFNHQEIEFTFEGSGKDKLYLLQTRDMDQVAAKRYKRFKDTSFLQSTILGTGIGVSGGALCGRAVYTEEDIKKFRKEDPQTSLILLRRDTVPDDVGILLQVEGLLTAKGGGTSHAAVTIPQLDKVGVVGFNKLKVHEAQGFATIDECKICAGDFICIDGWSGMVYQGKHEYDPLPSRNIKI